jgi:hypothetical protein
LRLYSAAVRCSIRAICFRKPFCAPSAGRGIARTDVDILAFLAETMHSIASDEAKKRARHRELQTVPLFAEDALAHDPPDPEANAEEVLAGEQEAHRIRHAVIDLFAEDPVAQVMVEGMMEDMEGEELREVTGLTKIGFASKRRLIRRRVDQAFPHGWTP